MRLDILETKLGYEFQDKALLRRALSHRSYGGNNNERLEFLGDSILSFVMADILYQLMPQHPEGDLTRVRSTLVRQETLVKIAHDLDLPNFVILGEGELKSGGFKRASILADTVEAIIGGVYLDAGDVYVAYQLIKRLFDTYIKSVDMDHVGKDKKSLLQEMTQTFLRGTLPKYEVIRNYGEPHDQTFEVSCKIDELSIYTEGSGSSKRIAEQVAADKAYQMAKEMLKNKKPSKSLRKVKQLTLPVSVAQRDES
ncbi:ribonuclease III [Basilea psittacipulmonis]|uniref:Ribonuclease 3 n=1 Tax=Basilea psittacipulmonis DSM 24701 TaxID=1072685 RepID=A0A077DEU3_9BURK|nr:ribonuclease III [Basilea psittacipulmonis]AIL33239.1 hypothetical protein IX83_07975 [Basilea psittacipulmonis DSM 24701]